MFDEISHVPAMGASSEFQLGVQFIKFLWGRTDFDTHAIDPLKLATSSLDNGVSNRAVSLGGKHVAQTGLVELSTKKGEVEAGYNV
jgi:hypothetical protein